MRVFFSPAHRRTRRITQYVVLLYFVYSLRILDNFSYDKDIFEKLLFLKVLQQNFEFWQKLKQKTCKISFILKFSALNSSFHVYFFMKCKNITEKKCFAKKEHKPSHHHLKEVAKRHVYARLRHLVGFRALASTRHRICGLRMWEAASPMQSGYPTGAPPTTCDARGALHSNRNGHVRYLITPPT